MCIFFFSSRRRHTRCALVTGVQTCALPISDLTATGQLDIDLREQLRVEQRAVEHTVAAIDAETGAQGIERVLGARLALARDRERIDHPLPADRHPPAAAKLAVDERSEEHTSELPSLMRLSLPVFSLTK